MRGPINAIKQGLKPHLSYLAVLGLIKLLAGFPLFQFKIINGHDSLAYLPRSIKFYEGLRYGSVFPRLAPDFAYGYGQPTVNFNPPVVYYLTAFFHVIGFGFLGAQNVVLLVHQIISPLQIQRTIPRFWSGVGPPSLLRSLFLGGSCCSWLDRGKRTQLHRR